MDVQVFQLIGRPGSGKGTQAKLLAQKIGATIVSPGTEFRRMIAEENLLGRRIKVAMESGLLMPTWLASYMFQRALFSLNEGEKVIFESGCRIKPEAELFDEITTWLGLSYKVIYFDVSEEVSKERLLGRQSSENRADDHSIQKRIEEYTQKTIPSVEFFRQKGALVSIQGEQPVEDVHTDTLKALGL
jgi:adenylate kinase